MGNKYYMYFDLITYIVVDYNKITVIIIFNYTKDNSNFFLKNSSLKYVLL